MKKIIWTGQYQHALHEWGPSVIFSKTHMPSKFNIFAAVINWNRKAPFALEEILFEAIKSFIWYYIHTIFLSEKRTTRFSFQKTTNNMILTKHPLLAPPLLLITAASNINPVASAGAAFNDIDPLRRAVDSYCGGSVDAATSPYAQYGWVVVPDHRVGCRHSSSIIMKQRRCLWQWS